MQCEGIATVLFVRGSILRLPAVIARAVGVGHVEKQPAPCSLCRDAYMFREQWQFATVIRKAVRAKHLSLAIAVGIVYKRGVYAVGRAVSLEEHSLRASAVDKSSAYATVVGQREESIETCVQIHQRIAVAQVAVLGVGACSICHLCSDGEVAPCRPSYRAIDVECLHAFVTGIVGRIVRQVERHQFLRRDEHAAVGLRSILVAVCHTAVSHKLGRQTVVRPHVSLQGIYPSTLRERAQRTSRVTVAESGMGYGAVLQRHQCGGIARGEPCVALFGQHKVALCHDGQTDQVSEESNYRLHRNRLMNCWCPDIRHDR